METIPVTCPSCFESFEVAQPHPDECPCEVDYDCEVCCRPMVIAFDTGAADARSLDD
ncbi:MAG: CPXCG motif-containing cysteine-rich protein [Akkermansiaceae bacterium]